MHSFVCHSSQRGLPRGLSGKESPCNADKGMIPESGRSPEGGSGNPLQFLIWIIPWTEEPDGQKSIGSQRVGHDLATNIHTQSVYLTLIF